MKKIFFIILYLFEMIVSNSVFSNENEPIKVYDCFTFFNELELLEVRLHELYDVVDHFVIVESSLTYSGNEKPLFFEQNKKRFSKYLDKIIHIVSPKIEMANDAWVREIAQRNDIMLGLKAAKDDDIIIISDLDEIVKNEKIIEIKKQIALKKDPIRLSMKMYRYFLNRRDLLVNNWSLSLASSYKTLKKTTPQKLRCETTIEDKISDAGWHFSSLGWIDKWVYKLESYSHQERNKAKNKVPKKILKEARKGKIVKIDNSYPKYIVDNPKYFKDRNFIDDNFPPNWNIRVFNKRQKKIKN